MISFLGAAAYVVVPGDVQWARLGPYERSGDPCPQSLSFDLGFFWTPIQQDFCSRKMESKALFFDGYGRGGGTSHLGPFPGPAQRRVQENTRGGAVLS